VAGQGKSASASGERLKEYGREMRREGDALTESMRGAAGEMQKLAAEQVEGRPYLALGAAFGFGLVLGGGVPMGAMRFAVRTAAGMLAAQAMEAIVPSAPAPRAARRRRSA